MTKENNAQYPDFSVLMSLYIKEKAEYFDACMQSMERQTVLPTEIVIVFDGPITEELRQTVQKYRDAHPGWIKTVENKENKGLGLALADGIPACTYELIARMDTDDIAREDRFEKQLQMFLKHPELDICGSQITEFEGSPSHIVSKRIVPLTDAEIKAYQKRRDAFNHMTVMYRKSTVLRAGNYQSCMLMEDTLLWVNMILAGAVCCNIDEPLVNARVGQAMFERRGGWAYFKKYKNGRKRVRETGYISAMDYYYTLAVQLVVALVPGSLRGFIFKKLLHRG